MIIDICFYYHIFIYLLTPCCLAIYQFIYPMNASNYKVEVLWSKGSNRLPPLFPLLVKGRNLYKLRTFRQVICYSMK
jgi:hypothetical protein